MAKKLTPQEKLSELINQLQESFSRWEYLYNNGGSDPFWSDGVNLNLVRNHILYYKSQILELCEENPFFIPEEYDHPTPEIVPDDYMAKSEEIRKNAEQASLLYEETDVFTKLADILKKKDKKDKPDQSLLNIIGYKRACEQAIQENDLVAMRRFYPERVEKDIEAAKKYLEELKEAADEPQGTQGELFV